MSQPLIHLPMGHAQHAPDLGYRPNVVLDWNMALSGTGNWTVGNNATLTKQAGGIGQVLRVAYTDTSYPYARQDSLPSSTGYYHAKGRARGDGSHAPRLWQGDAYRWTGTSSTDWQEFDFFFTANTVDYFYLADDGTDAGYVEWDWISIERVFLVDEQMENAGVGDWTAINDATLSKQTGTPPEGGGTQVLRVAYNGTANAIGRQTNVFTATNTYHVQGWVRPNTGAGGGAPQITSGVTLWAGNYTDEWQYFDFVFTATTGTLNLYCSGTTAGSYTEWAWIKIREVLPRTLNTGKGGDYYDAQLGDGSTSTTYPTKLPQCDGYEYDGGDYNVISDVRHPSGSFTAFATFLWDHADDGVLTYLLDHSSGSSVSIIITKNTNNIVRGSMGGTAGSAASTAHVEYETGTVGTVVCVWDGTDNKIWFNGVYGTDATVPVTPVEQTRDMYIGSDDGLTSEMTGKIFDYGVEYGIAWSGEEAAEYHRTQMAKGYK